jgi:hypothetical protein
MNQLQWSSHHWLILAAFLGLATLETTLGSSRGFYWEVVQALQLNFGLSENFAYGTLIAGKLALMIGGAYALSVIVWFAGSLFGKQTSRRVLFRRLAIVFTFLLTGYLLQTAFAEYAGVFVAGYAFYLWGLVLGYFSIREHFVLNTVESAAVGLFALLLVTSTWHYSTHFFDGFVKHTWSEMAKRPAQGSTEIR